jgi:hypothetical protein
MLRVLLVLALAVPIHAAPRLKDRKPPLDPEGARIAALKAKYDQIRKSGDKDEQVILALQERQVETLLQLLDRIESSPDTPAVQIKKRALEERMLQRPVMRELFDIAVYDRKKAAEKK